MMKNLIGYKPTSGIKKFECLQKVAMWAGFIGMGQALIWMALTITGILSYNCKVYAYDKLTFGALISQTFLDLYFTGSCTPPNYNEYDNRVLKSVSTVLTPTDILIWECVYLGMSFLWFVSSVLIITNLKKDNKPGTGGLLLIWVFITCSISLMDLALGIIFGIDYGNFYLKAFDYNFNTAQAGIVDPLNAELVAGSVVAMSLMIITLRGFVVWIINVALLTYLGIHGFKIIHDVDGNDTLFMPRKNSDDILTSRPPINAYEDLKINSSYDNDAYVPDARSTGTVELNQEALTRAAHMSTDSSLQERRFRNLEAYQQYPPPRPNSFQPKGNKPQEQIVTPSAVSSFPAPDYSPPMSRANQAQSTNGLLRNQRY